MSYILLVIINRTKYEVDERNTGRRNAQSRIGEQFTRKEIPILLAFVPFLRSTIIQPSRAAEKTEGFHTWDIHMTGKEGPTSAPLREGPCKPNGIRPSSALDKRRNMVDTHYFRRVSRKAFKSSSDKTTHRDVFLFTRYTILRVATCKSPTRGSPSASLIVGRTIGQK